MRAHWLTLLVQTVVLLSSCATADGSGSPGQDMDASDPSWADASQGFQPSDAMPGTSPDAATTQPDAQPDAMVSSVLDPELEVPSASNEVCSYPGSLDECSGIAVCRFYSDTEGRCESCESCGNLNAFCSSGEQCDILFMCFQGRCTNFCTLGSYECGPIEDCVDVGHPTRGVCRP